MKRIHSPRTSLPPRISLIRWFLGLALAVAAAPPAAAEPPPDMAKSKLAEIEARLRAAPDSLPRTHAYRLAAREARRLSEATLVLEELVASHPEAVAPRLDLALALIDRLADPELDLPRRAVIASQATRHLNDILTADPTHWAARYVRGMTHLLWPSASQHIKPAIDDFERLVATQPEKPEAYQARVYLALGDAYVMSVNPAQARAAWRRGQEFFPEDPELGKRLAMSFKEMKAFVLETFGLDRPFATDLSFLWAK